jgi:hypothetical protein
MGCTIPDIKIQKAKIIITNALLVEEEHKVCLESTK